MGKLIDFFRRERQAPSAQTAPAPAAAPVEPTIADPAPVPPVRPAVREAIGTMVDIEIVGESHCAQHVRAMRKLYGEREFEIVLRADPHNPYDENAVVVLVHDQRVGYLSRGMAVHWQPMILAAEAEGYTIRGRAVILGGTRDKPNLGVFGAAPWVGPDRPRDRWGS